MKNPEVLFWHTLWKCFDRHAAKCAACRYITQHFQPSTKKHPRSVYSLKHDFEEAASRYISETDYTESLRQCGFKVVDGKLYAREMPCS